MIGTGRWSVIFNCWFPLARLALQGSDGAFEVEYLPERDAEVQQPDATHRASYPTGSDYSLQTLYARLARSIQQKIVVAPITNSPHTVGPPRQYGQEQAYLEAQNNIENDA